MDWVKEAKDATSENISITIVGNKCEDVPHRVIVPEDAANFAGEHGCLYEEASAATGFNVDDIFRKIAYTITYQLENGILKKDEISAVHKLVEPKEEARVEGDERRCHSCGS